MFRIRTSLLVICLGLLVTTSAFAQSLTNLLQRVPDSANMVAVVDVQGLMQSNLAGKEGWAQQRSLDYLSGRTAFPPSTTTIVSAAQFNPALHQFDWQVGLMQFSNAIDPFVVARKEGSEVEYTPEGMAYVASRRNSYFLQLDRFNFGMFVPAHRQNFMKWASFARNNSGTKVSQYLIDSVNAGGAMGQFSLALELKDAFNKNAVRQRLELSPTITSNKADVDAWTKFIMGIRGLRFSAQVDNDITAELQLDFSDDVGPFAELIPALALEVFGGLGFQSGEVATWKGTARGKTYRLRGKIDVSELRKIAGMVLPMMPNTEPDENLPPEKLKVVTSQRFLRACSDIMVDLRRRSDALEQSRNYSVNAQWHEYYARKIDQLPTMNVDEDLLRFAQNLTGKLRDMGDSLRGVDIQNRVLQSYEVNAWTGASWGGQAYYGGTGFSGNSYVSNAREINSAKIENAAKGARFRNEIWVQLNNNLGDIRRVMSQRYQVDF